ncbi:MAG: PilZ domain-containing protein [Thermodesulfobacteriota bacterium]
MFWKKEENKYTVNLKNSDNRSSYRYYPGSTERLFAVINGGEYEVNNISAGGIAFYNEDFEPGEKYHIILKFSDDEKNMVTGNIEVISCEDLVCRCRFVDMTDEEIEKIHKFVFDKQLKVIREKRKLFKKERFSGNR